MNLVDSCGWLEYFAGGPRAELYASAIEDTATLVVPTVVILEVFKRVLQQRGEVAALLVAAAMQQGNVVDLDTPTALGAATLGVAHGLPLADSVILATSRTRGALVLTQDVHFRGLAGVRYCEP